MQFLFFIVHIPKAYAGSHFAHFYFWPNTVTKVQPGTEFYTLLYVGIKVTGQHPFYGGKLDITYPTNLTFVRPHQGVFFRDGITITGFQDTSPGHTLISFKSNNMTVKEGGKTQVLMTLQFRANTESPGGATQVITINPSTSVLYNKDLMPRSGGEPFDILQPAMIIVTNNATVPAPPIPTAKPGNGDPYPTKTPYTYVPTNVTEAPTSPTPTTPVPTPTISQIPAQTFNVTVTTKTNHPNIGGSPNGFSVDEVEGRVITLVRGRTYAFNLSAINLATHPFYISSNVIGNGQGIVDEDITETGSLLYFTPNASTPDLLYYQCIEHDRMGWKINIVNSLPTPTTSQQTPTPAYLRSDFGGGALGAKDGRVTIQDLNILYSEFYRTDIPILKSNIAILGQSATIVDIQDYNLFTTDFRAYLDTL